MRWTTAEIAEKLGVDKESARGLVKYLVADGLAEAMGVRRGESGRGENLYQIVDGFEERLLEKLRRIGG